MINYDNETSSSDSFNKVNAIAGFVMDNEYFSGEDILFAREVLEEDPRVFSPADTFINTYLTQNNERKFETKHAVVITYSLVFYSNYQIIIATDFNRTFAVMSFGMVFRSVVYVCFL